MGTTAPKRPTAPFVLAALLAACGPAPSAPVATTPSPTATEAPSATATAVALPTWPLRGTQAPDAEATKRRPVVVKIDNYPDAYPQSGLQQADVVFEVEAEFGITRFATVFHSMDAERIGPVRSARLSDLEIVPTLRGILAHVGAEPQTLDRVREAAQRGQLVDVDEFTHRAAFERIRERVAPHNTYTSTQRLREAAKDSAKVDVPAFSFGDHKAAGKDASALTLAYPVPSMVVTYELNGDGFKRTQGGRITDATPINVIVIKTDIREGHVVDAYGSRAHEIRSTGDGPVVVLSAGKRYEGTWTRKDMDQFRFADASGAEIRLRPGLTWIHIVPITFDVR